MTINLREDAPNQVSNVNPDELSKEINTLQEIKQEVINQENKSKIDTNLVKAFFKIENKIYKFSDIVLHEGSGSNRFFTVCLFSGKNKVVRNLVLSFFRIMILLSLLIFFVDHIFSI